MSTLKAAMALAKDAFDEGSTVFRVSGGENDDACTKKHSPVFLSAKLQMYSSAGTGRQRVLRIEDDGDEADKFVPQPRPIPSCSTIFNPPRM
ncbi:MAG: hypothetical protein R3C05_08580 [Pirellulaceae bacterium]